MGCKGWLIEGNEERKSRSMRFKNTLTQTFPFLLHYFQFFSDCQALRPYLGPLFNFCYGVLTLLGQCKEREVRWFLSSVCLSLSSVISLPHITQKLVSHP